jgi:hypothetical protein
MRRGIPILAFLFAAAFGASMEAQAQSTGFRVDRVSFLTFVEAKEAGETINHSGLQAHVTVGPGTTTDDMDKFADQLQDTEMRAFAEKEHRSLVFITFYTEKTTIDGKESWKLYRVIFVKDADGWKRRVGKSS